MVKEIKAFGKVTYHRIEKAYEVLTMAAFVAAATKLALQPHVNDMPIWQVVAGLLYAWVIYRVFSLLDKE